ncbi:hypothetical protein FEM48_Zijuj03G0051300 [Ziziphus jujuba var. spinosa]|uniref:Uncharacterized protein n=1 Tax=Ziziphus jujuba var. spinosa TaxID=714518 RepID=A0A978VNC7_ZIZJJ|nr:hypothetical protein FEM48_Zijuj03G0051300 [Ziziphus jujuba var. spinosa]
MIKGPEPQQYGLLNLISVEQLLENLCMKLILHFGRLGHEFDAVFENLLSRRYSTCLTEVHSRLLAFEHKLEEYDTSVVLNIGGSKSANFVHSGNTGNSTNTVNSGNFEVL